MLAIALLCLLPLGGRFPRVLQHPEVSPVAAPALEIRPLARHDGLTAEQHKLVVHLSTKYRVEQAVVERVVKAAYAHAPKANISPLLVLAIIEQESSFRPKASNSYGAVGLMQVVPRWHPEKLPFADPVAALKHPETNVAVGTRIVAEYLRQKRGNVQLALKKYSGNATDYATKVLRNLKQLEAQAGAQLAAS